MANTTPLRNKEDFRSGSTGQFGTDKSKSPEGSASITEKAKDLGSSVADKAKEFGSNVADQARDTASTVADKAKDAASSAASTAKDMASTVGQKAEDATSAVGSGMSSLAGTIREKAPHEGMLGSASATIADTLDRSGRYLQEEGLQGIADDLTNLIRRNPLPALFVGIGLGYLIARATTRR